MHEHLCKCGRRWLIEGHTSTNTEVGSLECRCGQKIAMPAAGEQHTTRQIWDNPVVLREALQTSKPTESFPPGTEIHVSTYATGGLRLIYVGERTYFVEEMMLVCAIEGSG